MNKRWIEAAGVRAVKTMARTAIATIGTAAQEQNMTQTIKTKPTPESTEEQAIRDTSRRK